MDDAGIVHKTLSFNRESWNLGVKGSANVDRTKALIEKAIEGSFGQWTDAAQEVTKTPVKESV